MTEPKKRAKAVTRFFYCAICHKKFFSYHNGKRTTCSKRCGYELIKRRTKARRTQQCKGCGKAYVAWRTRQKFCSRYCAVRGRSGHSRRADPGNNCRCYRCHKPLYIKPHCDPTRRHFCSRKCRAASQSLLQRGKNNPNFRDAGRQICEHCKRTFKDYKKRRFCSIRCAARSKKASKTAGMRFYGDEAELKCVAELKRNGVELVFKSAGSMGPFDIIAIDGITLRLIQVKRTSKRVRCLSKRHRDAVASVDIPETLEVSKELWCLVDGEGWHTLEGIPS